MQYVACVVHFRVENFAGGAVVADLPALFGVKRGLGHYDKIGVGTLDYRAYGGRKIGEVGVVVAGKLRGVLHFRGVGHAYDFARLGVAGALALLVHLNLKALFVHGHIALARDELG